MLDISHQRHVTPADDSSLRSMLSCSSGAVSRPRGVTNFATRTAADKATAEICSLGLRRAVYTWLHIQHDGCRLEIANVIEFLYDRTT